MKVASWILHIPLGRLSEQLKMKSNGVTGGLLASEEKPVLPFYVQRGDLEQDQNWQTAKVVA